MRLRKVTWLAEFLDVPLPRAYELLRSRQVPAIRLGRQIRVDEDQVREYCASGGRSLPGGWRREPVETQEATR